MNDDSQPPPRAPQDPLRRPTTSPDGPSGDLDATTSTSPADVPGTDAVQPAAAGAERGAARGASGADTPLTDSAEDAHGPAGTRRLAWLRTKEVWIGVATTVIAAAVLALVPATRNWAVDKFTDDWRVSVQADQDKVQVHGHPLSGQYVIPSGLDHLDKPPRKSASGCTVSNAWAARQGGVVADLMALNVVLTRRTDAPTTIDNADIVQEPQQQHAPLGGVLPSCGGGAQGVPILMVDLYRDPSKSTWHFVDADGHDTDFNFDTKLVKILVVARAHDCDCQWSLSFDTSRGAGHSTIRIDNNGKPFRTTSTQNAFSIYADSGVWKQSPLLPPAPSPSPDGTGTSTKAPPFDACTLVTSTSWSSAVGTHVSGRAATGSDWRPGTLVPGDPQLVSNCGFFFSAPSGRIATVKAVAASSAQQARDVAKDWRHRQAAARWVRAGAGTWVDGRGGLVVTAGTRTVIVFMSSPELTPTGPSAELAGFASRLAHLYRDALARPGS